MRRLIISLITSALLAVGTVTGTAGIAQASTGSRRYPHDPHARWGMPRLPDMSGGRPPDGDLAWWQEPVGRRGKRAPVTPAWRSSWRWWPPLWSRWPASP